MLSTSSLYDEDYSSAQPIRDACEKLETHAPDGDAAARLMRWASGAEPLVDTHALCRFVSSVDTAALYNEFAQVLPFGTGGRRGHVGFGSNRINPTLLALTVQGHCEYLSEKYSASSLTVVVAYDVRVFLDLANRYPGMEPNPLLGLSSRDLGELAASIYAANGVRVYMPGVMNRGCGLTTPELSYAIRLLDAHGGVMLSASHNHPDDNGIKLYNEEGAQPIAPEDQRLTDAMGSVPEVRSVNLAAAIESGLVLDSESEIRGSYCAHYEEVAQRRASGSTRLVYTPLCGSGSSSVGRVLRQLGYDLLEPADQGPDGTFATIPFRSPNPEVPEAIAPAKRYADAMGVDIVLSTDPDADRIGVDVRDPVAGWVHFTGNQLATILAYYLLLDREGPRKSGLVIATALTTRSLERIVELSPASEFIGDLPVGFKYVGAVLGALERSGSYHGVRGTPEDLVLAAEESYGFLVTPAVRDKDATSAAIHLAQLHSQLSAAGRTLVDYYQTVLEEIGAFAEKNRSIILLGERGARDTAGFMANLRDDPPTVLGSETVTRVRDHWDEELFGPLVSETERLSRNTVSFDTRAFTVTVRPSNTEPKLKLYLQLYPSPSLATLKGADLVAAATDLAERLAQEVYEGLLARLGVTLSYPAHALPDIIPLPEKVHFDTAVVPELERRLTAGVRDIGEIERWLEDACSTMTPGASPLPAVIPAIRRLWSRLDQAVPCETRPVVDAWLESEGVDGSPVASPNSPTRPSR